MNKSKVLSGMEEYVTRLKLLPVCNCGYIFRDGVTIYKNTNEVKDIKYATYSISPNICPNCKKHIECVAYGNDIIKEDL